MQGWCENTPEVFPGDFGNCFWFWALISSYKILGIRQGSLPGEQEWECASRSHWIIHSKAAWSAGGLARCEESEPGGCWRGVGKSSEMTQPRMKEREFWGREGKLKLAPFQFSQDSRGAGWGWMPKIGLKKRSPWAGLCSGGDALAAARSWFTRKVGKHEQQALIMPFHVVLKYTGLLENSLIERWVMIYKQRAFRAGSPSCWVIIIECNYFK